jgi:hypothetical protein
MLYRFWFALFEACQCHFLLAIFSDQCTAMWCMWKIVKSVPDLADVSIFMKLKKLWKVMVTTAIKVHKCKSEL